jgi:hypothetical protein
MPNDFSIGEDGPFGAQMFPAKSGNRGASTGDGDLEAFSRGHLKRFDFQHEYGKVFLGSDFYESAMKEKSCDSLRMKIGKVPAHFIPVSDGLFFSQSVYARIEELDGYYKFRNSKNLPGILPNVDIYVRMETYQHGKSSNKNCVVLKFLIPEDKGGKIIPQRYLMRNDGVLNLLEEGSDPDFKTRKDFFQYAIFPLNDPAETTHLVGKDFHIMGSFARQKQCPNMNGLLFPTSRNGSASGCVFFRKIKSEEAPVF